MELKDWIFIKEKVMNSNGKYKWEINNKIGCLGIRVFPGFGFYGERDLRPRVIVLGLRSKLSSLIDIWFRFKGRSKNQLKIGFAFNGFSQLKFAHLGSFPDA